ncbi:MAG: IPT/TIG domain-containing protein [Cytophagales bacterium]|nr:IPT/TIG domain-containing protein [Cytophagales bacterium]
MKKTGKYKFGILVSLLLVAGFAFLSSCQEEEGSSEVILLSFGPSGVHHGDEITFFGQNLDKVSAIVFAPSVEIPKSAFNSSRADRINITVPEAAEAGKIILKTPQGDLESKTILNFEVPVVITSITPEAKPGSTITIRGEKINWIERLTFPSDIVLTKEDFTSQSLTELVVTVPLDAQTGFLLFATGGTKPLTFGSEDQLIVTVPAVTAVTPAAIRHTGQLTITGTNLDLITAVQFGGGASVSKANFASHSQTEIKLAVPATTLKGKLTLKQQSPVDIQTPNELVIILPIGTTATPSPAIPGTSDLTISGTDLDLVAELGLPVYGSVQASAFKSQSATQIVVAVPVGTKSGGITYTTIHGFSGNLGVTVRVPAPGPAPLPITLYDETIAPGGGNWSWNAVVSDVASTEQFYSGDVSWKFETTSGGGLSAGGITAINVSGQQVFTFALYGGPGTNGREVAAILNDNWGDYNAVVLEEGKWTEYQIPLSRYPTTNLNQIVRFAFKVEGISSSIIYADRVGFGAAGPPPLDYYIYDDAVKNNWQQWDGWGLTSKDFANEEEVFKGTKSIKVVYNDTYGAIQIGRGSAFDMSGYTTLTFRVYASAAQNLIVQLNNDSDNYLSIPQGWSEVALPIATMNGNTGAVSELRIKNNNSNLPVTIYYDEIGLRN